MCGRYYRRGDKQKIAEQFRVRNDISSLVVPDADYNVAPTTMQPVIRQARDTKDRELILMRWGLIPSFTKSLSDVKGISTINARAETVATSGTFRVPFERRRCLIPASGFYEWKKLDPKRKQPWRYDLANGHMFAFCRALGCVEGAQAIPAAKRHLAAELHRHHHGPERTHSPGP